MKHLKVPYIKANIDDIESIHSQIDSLPTNQIDIINWKDYPSKPLVNFKIAHNSNHLLLKYNVEENEILALTDSDNGNVWEDSCVEFFIAFDYQTYYNLECNCIGTVLLRHQNNDKSTISLCTESLLSQIKRYSFLGNQTIIKQKGNLRWSLLLIIPIDVFWKNKLQNLEGMIAKGNFYKCGDGLSEPHFLTWSEIDSPIPNFHLPQYFGKIEFDLC